MQLDRALGVAAGLLVQAVDVLGDDVRQTARGLQPRQRQMTGIRSRITQRRVPLAAFLPVLAAGSRVLAEIAERRRRVALLDTAGSPVVRNARFGADARTGKRTDGVG